MKSICLLLATAAKLSAAILAHYDFNSLSIGENARMISPSPVQVVAAMPGNGSPAMLMTAGGGTGNPELQYSQVVLAEGIDLLSAAREFELTFDFYLSNLQMRSGPGIVRSAEEFSLLFDTPVVQRLDFGRVDGTGGIHAGGTRVGGFSFDAVHRFRAVLDLDARTWSAWLDGVNFMDSVSMNWPQRLTSVRLNLSDDMTLAGAPSAWVDNITLTSIPEPCAASLLLMTLATFRRRR